MDPLDNPYTPGAGRRPSSIVGRDAELLSWRAGIARTRTGDQSPSMVLVGLRGAGKTVLLGEFAGIARRAGWIVAARGGPRVAGLRAHLSESLHAPLVAVAADRPGPATLRALRTALSFFSTTVERASTWAFPTDLSGVEGNDAASGALEDDLIVLMRDLCAAADERGVGVALLLDVSHELEAEELDALCAISRQAHEEGWPFMMAMAGLPPLVPILNKVTECTARSFDVHELGPLAEPEARALLAGAAGALDVEYTVDALDLLVEEGAGNPYLLQQVGHQAWLAAHDSPIDVDAAHTGVERSHAILDRGFYAVRWEMASGTEQKYLETMAEDGDGGSSTTVVAHKLGTSTKAIGTIRARLIQKGLIYTPSYGQVAFTMPSMAGFIHRQS